MVLYDDNAYYAYPKIEQQRKRLKNSTADVNHTDYGTGACARGENAPVQTRRVADIARTHLESPSIGQLLSYAGLARVGHTEHRSRDR